jgi:hypothetical protein
VLDMVVTIDAATDLRDESGVAISRDAFFARAAGHDVSVSAAVREGVLYATSVRLDY